MLLTSTQIVPVARNDNNNEESALLRCGIAELNRNTVRLIAKADRAVGNAKIGRRQRRHLTHGFRHGRQLFVTHIARVDAGKNFQKRADAR
jgi:hypothetical protein